MLAVADGDTSRSVNLHHVLVKLTYFDDDPRLVPFHGVRTDEVLKTHCVTDDEWGQHPSVFGEPFVRPHVAVAKCLFALGEGLPPCAVGLVFAGMDWDKIPDRPSEDNLGGRHASVAVRRVAVLQYGTLETICVQTTIW